MPSIEEEELTHRKDRCCVHRVSADRPADVNKDADLARCLLQGRRVVASWLVDPSSEHPKVMVVLSPAQPDPAPVVQKVEPAPRWQDRYSHEISFLIFAMIVVGIAALSSWGLL